MVEVLVSDLRIGDMVARPGAWEGLRRVASVDGDDILTGDPIAGWRRDGGVFLRARPYSPREEFFYLSPEGRTAR